MPFYIFGYVAFANYVTSTPLPHRRFSPLLRGVGAYICKLSRTCMMRGRGNGNCDSTIQSQCKRPRRLSPSPMLNSLRSFRIVSDRRRKLQFLCIHSRWKELESSLRSNSNDYAKGYHMACICRLRDMLSKMPLFQTRMPF